MFGNIFKTEAAKAKEELNNHIAKINAFVEEHELQAAWERTRDIVFRNMDIDTYITKSGEFNRSDFYFNHAKEKLVQCAFTSYILVKALPLFYNEHLITLKRKERTLSTQDDYGVWNFDKWIDEIDYFYENVVRDRINVWIEDNTEYLNTFWPIETAEVNVWGRPVYYQFTLPEQFDRCAKNFIISAVDMAPEPELPGYSEMMDGHAYEYFLAAEFEKAGANAQVTKGSGDHGLDILVSYRDVRIAVQCKHYQAKVGNSAIQEVFSAKQFYDCTLAVVISNSEYTPHARQAAQKLDVYHYHHEHNVLTIQTIDGWLDETQP